MNKKEAQNLIGTRVEAWTSANGVYAGILEEVIAEKGRPWRGKVLIDSIFQPAQHFERNSACRRGFRVGETIEVGGINISPTTKDGFADYREALRQQIQVLRERLKTIADSPHAWATKGFADAYEAALECEEERLLTGEWDRRKLMDLYKEKSK